MASVRTAAWNSSERHGQFVQTALQAHPREGAASANEATPLVGPPDQLQAHGGNTTPRTILPNSYLRPLAQQINPAASSAQNIHNQTSQQLLSNERFAAQYRSDASPRMYSSGSGPYNPVNNPVHLPVKSEMMAATQGPLGPTMASYPSQAQSPTPMSPPGHHVGRSMYPSGVQPSTQFYYNTYMSHNQPHYAYQPSFSAPTPQQQYGMQHFQQSHHLQPPQSPAQHYSTNFESSQTPKVAIQRSVQVQPGGLGNASKLPQQSQSSPTGNSPGSAPGPIRATTPTVVKQDNNGVTTISFEYSKDRVKRPYEIRCDVEKVDLKTLSKEHKEENCVYPRACSGESYKGNRWQYENECNEVAWALAYLNPELRGKRGLIQRAVDSWRNSNKDKKLRSRRVRRLAKTERRAKMHQLQQEQQRYQHDTKQAQATAYMRPDTPVLQAPIPSTNGLSQPDIIAPLNLPQYHHHSVQPNDGNQTGHSSATGTSYGDTKTTMPSYQSQ